MKSETEISPIDFDLPKASGELLEHDYSEISPGEAFRLFEAQNRDLWERDFDVPRPRPCSERFTLD